MGHVRAMNEATGYQCGGPDVLRVMADRELLARALWVLVERQAATAGKDLSPVSPTEFAYSLTGTTMDDAEVAFAGAILGFTNRINRPTIEKLIQKHFKGQKELMETAEQEIDGKADRIIAEAKKELLAMMEQPIQLPIQTTTAQSGQ